MYIHERPAEDQFTNEPDLRPQGTSSGQIIDEINSLARQLARTLEAEFRAFADNARDYAFTTLSLDETVIGWSKGAELLGHSQEEILGQPGKIFFTPEDIARGEPA